MTDDRAIEQLRGGAPVREWLQEDEETHSSRPGTLPTAIGLHPNESLIEKLNGWLIERGNFDWEEGKFNNRSEALRRLGWVNNGRPVDETMGTNAIDKAFNAKPLAFGLVHGKFAALDRSWKPSESIEDLYDQNLSVNQFEDGGEL